MLKACGAARSQTHLLPSQQLNLCWGFGSHGSQQLQFLSLVTLFKRDKKKANSRELLAARPDATKTAPVRNLAAKLTELVADALVLQQRRVLEGVPAVQDPRVGAQGGDAAQRQHRVVYQQRGRLLPQPG